jgi:hypothetical protein
MSSRETSATPSTGTRRPLMSTAMRPKLAWDPSQLRVPHLSSRGKLILGACALLAAIWLMRGRSGSPPSPPDFPLSDAPTRLTVVPIEQSAAAPATHLQPPSNLTPNGSAATVSPQSVPSASAIRQAELPRHEQPPALPPPPSQLTSGERYSVAPPSMQPVPPWQDRSGHGAARQDVAPPVNHSSVSSAQTTNPPAADRGGAIPPPMPPLWPQDLGRGPAHQGPNIQRNQFVDQNPAGSAPVNSVDSQIEWAAPFAPGRGPGESVRTSDRRSEPSGARFEGSIQVSPQPRDYDGRSGSFVH